MIDGFTLNSNLRHDDLRSFGLGVGRLAELRASRQHMFRWYCVPEDPARTIDPYDTLLVQVRMQPGAVWWAMSFAAVSGSTTDFLLQASDGLTRKQFFSAPVAAAMFASSNYTRLRPVLLAAPTIIESGHINIAITNTSAAAVVAQVLLWVSEPEGV